MKKFFIYFCLASLIVSCVSCGKHSDNQGANKDLSQGIIQVVTTTGMIADAAKNVGGQRANVEALMGPGVDPHLYKASEGDVSLMMKADIIFYNGLHLEAKMGEVLEKFSSNKKIAAVSARIPNDKLISPPGFESSHDPHIWFDVKIWVMAVEQIRDTFIEADPSNAAVYQQNASNYIKELNILDKYIESQAKLIPEQRRVIVTAHDAFKYFGKSYGFEVKGLQGISTVTEAGTADVRNLADFIAQRKIPAIFVESSVPKRNIEALISAVSSRGFNVGLGGELFSDAMGNEGTVEGTYIGMVRHNIDTIVKALK